MAKSLGMLLAALLAIAATRAPGGDFVLQQFPIPAVELPPAAIASDALGNVWFAELGGQRIGERQANGTFRILAMHDAPSQIQQLAAGADGRIWFTQTWTYDGTHNRIGTIAQNGTVKMYPFPRKDAFLNAIAPIASGGVWVSEMTTGRIARVSNSGVVAEFALPGPSKEFVRSLVSESDGSVWAAQDNALVHVLSSGSATRFPVPLPRQGDGIRNIVRAGSGSFWMTLYSQPGEPSAIWRFTLPHTMKRYALPKSSGGGIDIASDSSGSVWFPELADRAIDRIDASGRLSIVRVPFLGSDIMGIAAGKGGIWLSNMQSERLVHFGSSISVRTTPAPAPAPPEKRLLDAWRAQLQPRSGYKMSAVRPVTLRIAGDYAVVGWSDNDGNAATLLFERGGHWLTMFVTNGDFYEITQLTDRGVPRDVAAELIKDSNVIPIP